MKKLIIGSFAAAMSLAAPMSMADNDGAGCGFGSQVFAGKSGTGINVLTSLLNAVLFQPSAMTSGSWNCDTTQVIQRDEMRDVFVASTFDSLSEEAARGTGNHVQVLAALSGVADADLGEFASLLQARHGELFSADSSTEMLEVLDVAMSESDHFSAAL